MSAPVTEPVHAYPPDGQYVTIEGVVSSDYLHQGRRMLVQWTQFWESMSEAGYVRPVNIELNPDAAMLFPNMAEVMQLITTHAITQPGEKILALRAENNSLFMRVGTDMDFSRELEVVVPVWQDQDTARDQAVAAATAALGYRDQTQNIKDSAQTNVQAAADAAAASVASQTQANATTATTQAGLAGQAKTAAELARDRAEAAAGVTDIQPASPTVTGIVRLAGDLAGTSTAPTVPGLASKYVKPAGGIPSSDLTAAVANALVAAASAYQRPGTGIPSSDMAAAVQTSLSRADNAYAKPGPGIPKADLVSAVQTSLGLADTSIQAPGGATGWKTWVGTEAQFQALATKDTKTFYYRTA